MPGDIFADGCHGTSDFKENCLRLSVVGGCHGNQLSVMGVM